MITVTVTEVINHFGSLTKTGAAIDRSRQAVSEWGLTIPENAADDLVALPDFPWNKKDLPIRKFRPGPAKAVKT